MQLETFEEKIEKLDDLLKKLNNEDINLADSVNLYKDGIKLVKEARQILESSKLIIKEVGEIDG
ncbi:exodeoxyribonuclease VII, small subunit [Campylobacter hyointestinalis subsp. lawsonii CCUG 27631]|uniref:exodeoxyribonuclease VII small subunit n=1 Tax=Campylobacter hyointestinalis TaxID=198 RepID=UPI0007C90357|nr:exodeoxyribonuclease VII small subunit [Campylobacter hyointestinalis]ANE33945.1 exodeoxyribonuclease VII, small subunit [Campylobacter hyointestinalis subsp. lawsonii CCUG 27631]